MFNKQKITAIIILSTSLLVTTAAQASLIGDTVIYDRYHHGVTQSHLTNTVGAGEEFYEDIAFGGGIHTDLGANSIRLDFSVTMSFPDAPNNYIAWTDLNWIGSPNDVVSGVTVTFDNANIFEPVGQLRTFSASNISFDDHAVYLDLAGYQFNRNSYVDIQLQAGPSTTTVPVPAAAWLFGSGLLALGGMASRRK